MVRNAAHRLTSSHHATSGSRITTSPPSKPKACKTRRMKVRLRCCWRASQRSNAQLKAMFQLMAMPDISTDSTADWAIPAANASSSAGATQATAMAS
ncbi:hypothetical protein D3C80_1953450 [compost metagenome]